VVFQRLRWLSPRSSAPSPNRNLGCRHFLKSVSTFWLTSCGNLPILPPDAASWRAMTKLSSNNNDRNRYSVLSSTSAELLPLPTSFCTCGYVTWITAFLSQDTSAAEHCSSPGAHSHLKSIHQISGPYISRFCGCVNIGKKCEFYIICRQFVCTIASWLAYTKNESLETI
jgi:hypothetical protein